MAKLKDLKVTIGLSKRGLTKLNSDLRRVKGNFRRNFGEIAATVKNAATVIGTVMVGAITAMLKAAADLERVRVSFRSIMGGAEGAARMVEKLNKFAASTPFQLADISAAARQLLAVGVTESDLEKTLRNLGDIAAASGSSITEMSAIYAKAQAKGKIDQEILNQLLDRGINIKKELIEITGQTGEEFEATAVSVEEFNQALRNMATDGGFAEGAMENLSTTTSGLLSTLADVTQQFLAQAAAASGLEKYFKMQLILAIGTFNKNINISDAAVEELSKTFNDLRERSLRPTQDTVGPLTDEFVALEAALKNGMAHADKGSATYKRLAGMLDGVNDSVYNLNQQFLAGLPPGTPKPKGGGAGKTEPTRPADMATAMTLAAGTIEQSVSEKIFQPLRGVADILEDLANNKIARLEEAQLRMAASLSSTFNSMFRTLIDGTQTFGQFMSNILQDLLIKLVSMAAAFAVITALTGGTVGAASFGGFLKAGFGIPQMAEGGLFTGASLAMVGEGAGTSMINPEVVAPLDKLQQMLGGGNVTVTGRLDGRDILISSERASFDRNRVRGF